MDFSNSISNLFGKSPIKPLQEHMALVVTCASHLEPFFEAVIANKWTDASDIFDRITDDENQADDQETIPFKYAQKLIYARFAG